MTTILLIEDETNLRLATADMLIFEGFIVLDAGNGRRGVEMAQQTLPDLIICDLMMPELDGFGVLRELHTSPATAQIPFLFLTSISDSVSQKTGLELGAVFYLVKPYINEDLLKAIDTVLNR